MTGMGELAMFRWDTNIREYQTWVLLVLGVYSGLIFGKFVFGGSGVWLEVWPGSFAW